MGGGRAWPGSGRWRCRSRACSTARTRHRAFTAAFDLRCDVFGSPHYQEKAFERFALLLARKTICPNLRPQTGPAGGGDGKVDSETTPVADSLSLAWVVGHGSGASSERWAFAFSAKEDWRAKVQSDVRKIAETKRGYVRAFFISNQAIPDRKRLELEDALTKECGLKVTIHDLTWIVDQVIDGKLEGMANDELQMGMLIAESVEPGPRDMERKRELETIESRLVERLASGVAGPREASDAIETATLARELEMARVEVEGRHTRALDLAERAGVLSAKIEAHYQYAWSAFWWFEDYGRFLDLYLRLETLVIESNHPGGLRRLHTLWSVLIVLERDVKFSRDDLNRGERTSRLSAALHRRSSDTSSPSAALEARANLMLMEAQAAFPHVRAEFMQEMKALIENSEGLVGFRAHDLLDLLLEFCRMRAGDGAWDDFHEWLVERVGGREGEVRAASMRLERAIQLMDAGRPYDGLVTAAKTLFVFYKADTHDELLDCLYVCSAAYERIGLRWAARGTLIHAASLMMGCFDNENDFEGLRAGYFRRLKWIELLLGRLPQALAWHGMTLALGGGYDRSPQKQEVGRIPDPMLYDTVLGMVFLRADADTLKKLEGLPDVLDRLDLPMACVALHKALGWEEHVPETLRDHTGEIFRKWRDQPAAADLPGVLHTGTGQTIDMGTHILGCEFRVVADENPCCEVLGELILAALEATLATGFRQQLFSLRSSVVIEIGVAADGAFPFRSDFADDAASRVTLSVKPFNPHKIPAPEMHKLHQALSEFLVHVISRVFRAKDMLKALEVLMGEERGMDRGVHFTGSFVTLGNVLGHQSLSRLKDWLRNGDKRYELRCSEPWDAALPRPDETGAEAPSGAVAPEGEPSHAHIRHESLIDVVLWDRAKWRGVLYAWVQGKSTKPPVMALVFQDRAAAAAIFSDWYRRWGRNDADESLRVVVIRGVRKTNPNAYRVIVTSNPGVSGKADAKLYKLVTCRIHTMEPADGKNLEMFTRELAKFGAFWLGYSVDEGKQGKLPEIEWGSLFLKRKIEFREAWTIGVGDIDSPGILSGDDPIIPAGVGGAPIWGLIDRQ